MLYARGMKLYLDIITNHTADVIAFRECHDPQWTGEKTDPSCPYRAIADYPYQTKGGPRGKKINKGFCPLMPMVKPNATFRASPTPISPIRPMWR